MARNLRFCIDRGGTFTDVYAELPGCDPPFRALKLLSEDPERYDDAPLEGIRRVLEEVTGQRIPRGTPLPTERIASIRMGTTVGTNALLERRGERTALCVTQGFRDLLRIGTQARPDIFDLRVRQVGVLYDEGCVVEVRERVELEQEVGAPGGDALAEGGAAGAASGSAASAPLETAESQPSSTRGTALDRPEEQQQQQQPPADLPPELAGLPPAGAVVRSASGELLRVRRPLDVVDTRRQLQAAFDSGVRSLAVLLLHSYAFPQHERAVAAIARSVGFPHVSLSSALVPMVRAVPRGHTACVDAYLTPAIQRYARRFLAGLDPAGLSGVSVSFMRSDGGLAPAAAFSGFHSILSGPAGGVVGFARTAFGFEAHELQGLPELGFLARAAGGAGAKAGAPEGAEAGSKGPLPDPSLSPSPFRPVIGFDMGGTSTDVSRYAGGPLQQVLETTTAGVTVQAPQLDIVTVAAGGGSRLWFEGGVLRVGPASVGAHPGPVCYRKGGQLAVTDANAVLGRLVPALFPRVFGPQEDQPLDVAASRRALEELTTRINAELQVHGQQEGDGAAGTAGGAPSSGARPSMSVEEVALGFLAVANEAMCRPIRELTEQRGFGACDHVLACFGGAGPQHACAVAAALRMPAVLVHPLAGLLSAVGMGLADRVLERQRPAAQGRGLGSAEVPLLLGAAVELVEEAVGELQEEEFRGEALTGLVVLQVLLNLRFSGTENTIVVESPSVQLPEALLARKGWGEEQRRVLQEVLAPVAAFDFAAELRRRFVREFGFHPGDRAIVVDDVRVRLTVSSELERMRATLAGGDGASRGLSYLPSASSAPTKELPPPEPLSHRCFFSRGGWLPTPVYAAEKLPWGAVLRGPALLVAGGSTTVVEPGWLAAVTHTRSLILAREEALAEERGSGGEAAEAASKNGAADEGTEEGAGAGSERAAAPWDVVRLSVFGHRFMSIAEQMGRAFQRTALSTNIKERLDFSCALFSADGGLVANAPHVPVHLGAMADTVRWQLQHWAAQQAEGGEGLREGDVLLSNHPAAGGSHLPDMTVVTPVFDGRGALVFLVASRGHHAEIGGATPGSMPPFSSSLKEEGAAVRSLKLVRAGEFQEAALREVLMQEQRVPGGGAEGQQDVVIPGTRRIEDNLADLRAAVAANNRGAALLHELMVQEGEGTVLQYMRFVQDNAEAAVRTLLRGIGRRQVEGRGSAAVAVAEGEGRQVAVLRSSDRMDDGSLISLTIRIDCASGSAEFDFTGTSPEVRGNWNAPRAVTTAAVVYCLRCLVDLDIPLNQGCLAPISISIPEGSFLAPSDTAAVVGGNVLTSQRVTDVILAAFQACAASQGCMNNLTFGDATFGYYETIAGGAGAGPSWSGTSCVQTHMTNTRITDPELLERRYPVLLLHFGIRRGSGGRGKNRGGDGCERELLFRQPVTVSLLTERRVLAPPGACGGGDGARGMNLLKTKGRLVNVGGKASFFVDKGDTLLICTPGGGAWGCVESV